MRKGPGVTRLRSHFTYANVVATLALFVALGGGAYAAVKLPANSVTTRQVKDHSLLTRDFRPGQLPRGAIGPQGLTGPSDVWSVYDSASTTGDLSLSVPGGSYVVYGQGLYKNWAFGGCAITAEGATSSNGVEGEMGGQQATSTVPVQMVATFGPAGGTLTLTCHGPGEPHAEKVGLSAIRVGALH
jgi:hypothetical protein